MAPGFRKVFRIPAPASGHEDSVSGGGRWIYNTPVIIKYPFWQMTAQNRKAIYACVNMGEAYAPREIANQSICIDGDIGEVLKKLK